MYMIVYVSNTQCFWKTLNIVAMKSGGEALKALMAGVWQLQSRHVLYKNRHQEICTSPLPTWAVQHNDIWHTSLDRFPVGMVLQHQVAPFLNSTWTSGRQKGVSVCHFLIPAESMASMNMVKNTGQLLMKSSWHHMKNIEKQNIHLLRLKSNIF